MNYQRSFKFKPLTLDPYEKTKGPINYVKSFRSYRSVNTQFCLKSTMDYFGHNCVNS